MPRQTPVANRLADADMRNVRRRPPGPNAGAPARVRSPLERSGAKAWCLFFESRHHAL